MNGEVKGFSKFDAAEYLKTEEDIAAYMNAVMQEGEDDAAYLAHALGVVARAKNMSEIARKASVSREGLYKALSKEGNPTFQTIVRVSNALGLKVSFEPATVVKATAGSPRALGYWKKKFDCSTEELLEAVKDLSKKAQAAVGHSEKVKRRA